MGLSLPTCRDRASELDTKHARQTHYQMSHRSGSGVIHCCIPSIMVREIRVPYCTLGDINNV